MPLVVKRNFGYLPDLPDYRDWKYGRGLTGPLTAESDVKLPARKIIPGLNRIPLMDQGDLGSCVGCSVAHLHAYERQVVPRSILQIYYEARRLQGWEMQDSGAYIRDAIKVISTLGAGRETWWPYDITKFAEDPPLKVDRDALARRVFSYWSLTGRQQYRQCLASGHPFVIGSMLYSNFGADMVWDTGIIGMPSGTDVEWGGHAYLVYGYDSNFRNSDWAQQAITRGLSPDRIPEDVYLCRNTWGSDWGHGGDFAVAADFIDMAAFSDDAWTVRKERDAASGIVTE